MIDENERDVCPPVLIVEAVSWTSPAGAETATFAWDLPLADDEERGACDVEGAFFALDDVFTASSLPLAGALLAVDDVFAAKALAFDAAGLDVAAPDLAVFAAGESVFPVGTRFFTDAATGVPTVFAFDLTALATEPALDDLTFFAVIYSISSKIN